MKNYKNLENMKANELMIGDWVEPHQCRIPTLYCKVEGIYPDGTVHLDKAERLFTLDELHPVPLTKEILEKNGFTCDANGMNDSDEPVVSVEYGEFQRNTDNGFEMLADGKAIKYVHELQHALRLCGVEKEINLYL